MNLYKLEESVKECCSELVAEERKRCADIASAHEGACQTGCVTGPEIAEMIRGTEEGKRLMRRRGIAV